MSPEFAFILSCASLSFLPQLRARAAELAAGPLDWAEVARLALRHGLAPLLYSNLAQFGLTVPQTTEAALITYAQHNAVQTSRLTYELTDLMQTLAAQGLPVLAYKGPLLAYALYGDTNLRQYNDLDLLIDVAEVPRASRLLQERGYQNLHPGNTQYERRFIQKDCEYTFFWPEQHIYLDLHWNFVPRYFALRLDIPGFWQRAQMVRLEDREVLGLSAEDTLLMLSINAAKDFWSRLLALCDIAAVAQQTPALDWPALWVRANAARAQRMLGLSLWLARDLLELPLPPFVEGQLAADTALPGLAAAVKELLFVTPLTPMEVNTFLLPAQALPSRLARWEFYLRLAAEPSPEDWEFVELPLRLEFLYYLTRPLRLARKYVFAHRPA